MAAHLELASGQSLADQILHGSTEANSDRYCKCVYEHITKSEG